MASESKDALLGDFVIIWGPDGAKIPIRRCRVDDKKEFHLHACAVGCTRIAGTTHAPFQAFPGAVFQDSAQFQRLLRLASGIMHAPVCQRDA